MWQRPQGFGTGLKAEEEVVMETALATANIIQQVIDAQFKQFKAHPVKNMEMMAKLMTKKQQTQPQLWLLEAH